jgi:acyl-CoA reductase-like NAD-dependent aldehyde dehydrogenase
MESRNWIGGEWVKPNAGQLRIKNPSNTAEETGIVWLSNATDVRNAIEAAHAALPHWADLTPATRADYLHKAAQLLEQQSTAIAELASREMGKPISEMKGEVLRGVNLLRYYAAEGVRAIGCVIPASQGSVLQYTKRVPLGVVGIITPWNFPIAIPIWKLAPALICGNTVVWKPAEDASLSATRLAQVFADAGLPAGVLNVVHGQGGVVGQALVQEGDIEAISFTGSTVTGMKVATQAASRNIKYQTEMGGKNAAVVLHDANLKVAVPAIVSGAFRSAGQKCTATSRVIVEKAVYTDFVRALQEEVSKLYIGSALDPRSYSGPVASLAQYEKVSSYVKLAEDEATTVAKAPLQVEPASGYYIAPLVVEGVDVSHRLVQEEVFGPLMTLLPVDDFNQAVALCNQTLYGLSASIFTEDLKNALRFLDEAEAGMVRVNLETAGVEYQAPFGGMKMSSSHSREQGQAALDFYSQVKTCAVYYG